MQNNEIEKKEKLSSFTETVSAETLQDIVYGKESFPKDKRFNPIEDGGVFKYFHPAEIVDYKTPKFYSIIKVGDKIIGLGRLQKVEEREKTFGINFLSIDPEYQGQGYASKLAEEMFLFAKNEGYSVLGSPYSDEGDKKLKPLFLKLADKLGVRFIDYKEGWLK